MNLAFCLIKYFPYGGLQRDFIRIAAILEQRGHGIHVYTPEWSGDIPDWLTVSIVTTRGFTNHARRWSLARQLARAKVHNDYKAVIGFSKMPGLDLYFAADSCFAAKAARRNFLYRLTGRCRAYQRLEKAVFDPSATTTILMLSEREKEIYQQHYRTPEERIFLLPPGISRDRLRPPDADAVRRGLRAEIGIGEDRHLVLMVGSGFRTKGADRSLRAVASLPRPMRDNTVFIAIGKDNFTPFRRLALRLGISEQVLFFHGRPDITRFLVAADLLIHPAYRENTGTVLIEAMAAQLPVLATDVCGYSGHVKRAQAGQLVPSPFSQAVLDRRLKEMLLSDRRAHWGKNGGRYVSQADVFSMPERAADIIEKAAAC